MKKISNATDLPRDDKKYSKTKNTASSKGAVF